MDFKAEQIVKIKENVSVDVGEDTPIQIIKVEGDNILAKYEFTISKEQLENIIKPPKKTYQWSGWRMLRGVTSIYSWYLPEQYEVIWQTNGKVTEVKIREEYDGKCISVGRSSCDDRVDTFDLNTGLKLAFSRALSCFYFKLSNNFYGFLDDYNLEGCGNTYEPKTD